MSAAAFSFEQIDPFVRYPHVHIQPPGSMLAPRAAYDYRMMYICGGSGKMIIQGISYEAVQGCFFLWKPGAVYGIAANEGGELRILSVNFDFTKSFSHIGYPIPPEDIGIFQPDRITECLHFSDMPELNDTVFLRNMQAVEPLLLEIVREYTVRKRFFMTRITGCFLQLLGDMARHITSTFDDPEGASHKADLILSYIREHYREPLSNRDIARHFSFHPVYLNRLLVKHTGTSLHQYLIRYRLSLAISLLQNSGTSVKEAALESGFTDVNYFSKCFRKAVGLSPAHYARTNRHSREAAKPEPGEPR